MSVRRRSPRTARAGPWETKEPSTEVQPLRLEKGHYLCAVCSGSFPSKATLIRHYEHCSDRSNVEMKSRKKSEWRCEICHRCFSRKYVLACHYRTHDGKKPYECAACGDRFTWFVQLRIHAAKHPGEFVFKCQRCDEKFKFNSELQKHFNTHPKKGVNAVLTKPSHIVKKQTSQRVVKKSNVHCSICNKYFHKMNYLKNHWRAVHKGERQHECAVCSKRFRWKMQLRIHAAEHPNQAIFKCAECGDAFKTTSELTKHKKLHPQYRYECEMCDEKFVFLKEILIHSKRHTRTQCYKCSDCDQCFEAPHLLLKHSASHNPMLEGSYDERGQRFHCGSCSACFSRSELLTRHVKEHRNPRPHQCEWCGKCFPRADNLRCHIRIHTGEKPYKCEHCPKAFKESGQLVKHRRIHTGEKPYICETCGKAFTDSSKVKKHIRSMHSGPNGNKKEKPPRPAAEFRIQKDPLPVASAINDNVPYECGICYDRFMEAADIMAHMAVHTGGATSCVFYTQGDSRHTLFQPNQSTQSHANRPSDPLLGHAGPISAQPPLVSTERSTMETEDFDFDPDVFRDFFQQQEQILAPGPSLSTNSGPGVPYADAEDFHSWSLDNDSTLARLTPSSIIPHQLLNDDSVIERSSVMPTSELTRRENRVQQTKTSEPASSAGPPLPQPFKRQAFYEFYNTNDVPSDLVCHCGREFKNRLVYIQHKNKHSGEKPFECGYCGQSFGYYMKFMHHVLKHQEYDKKCFVCNKEFDNAAKLLKHSRYHVSQSPNVCNMCDQVFSQTKSLEEHMRSAHSSAEPHQCEHCGKFFKLKVNLENHVRVHTGEKPFGPCEYCGKFFRESGQFKKHVRIHSNERPYQCPYCPKAFMDSTKRKRHCKNVHKDMCERYTEKDSSSMNLDDLVNLH